MPPESVPARRRVGNCGTDARQRPGLPGIHGIRNVTIKEYLSAFSDNGSVWMNYRAVLIAVIPANAGIQWRLSIDAGFRVPLRGPGMTAVGRVRKFIEQAPLTALADKHSSIARNPAAAALRMADRQHLER